ncbi:MAG TPA: DMT family transporter [Gammaproteobacteria bacterium]|nr:DMT family transporter [Gammaproteobacteria bacterium]
MRKSASAPDAAAFAALAFLTLVWGYNWVVMKVALQYTAPFPFAAARSAGGAACLLLLLAVSRHPFWPRHPGKVLLLGLLQTSCFIGFVCWALVQGGAGKSAVLAYTMPFWVILLAPFMLGERLKGLQWLAVILAFAGLLLIFSPWKRAPDFLSSCIALAAGIAWGLSVLVAKKIPVRDHWELLSITGWQMLMGAVPLVLVALLVPGRPVEWTTPYVAALLYNIIPANALAWALWLFVMGRLTATVSGLASLATPVVGMLCGWWQLGERPSLVVSGGMLMVLVALALLPLANLRRRSA